MVLSLGKYLIPYWIFESTGTLPYSITDTLNQSLIITIFSDSKSLREKYLIDNTKSCTVPQCQKLSLTYHLQ